jgi:hypothetical protein
MCEPITSSAEYRRTFVYLQHSERSELTGRLHTFVHYLKGEQIFQKDCFARAGLSCPSLYC